MNANKFWAMTDVGWFDAPVREDHEFNAAMGLTPTNRHGRRLRKRYGKVRSYLLTFPDHTEAPPDNKGSEREL